ncbi:unnamed protein product [Sphenostylis stenocarpa]|uniref:TAFII55 protein conserved region domain-containing protein n=1 Tax=Sphenostylis stenocarpa TaxID=92480 RepID=A0AA86SXD6_9FABA|nr:unnamed protein product [Sphenostylis stenocarpa]
MFSNMSLVMEEQFILRVPPNVAERIERLLNETDASSSEEKSLDLSFSEDGRSGTFMIGNEHFPASLLDLPCVVESYKTYDDNSLIKAADIGQMIMVRDSGDAAPDVIEYRHGLTPPMRDARKRRFRREPDLNPELVSRVEKDLLKIMAGGTAENLDILTSFKQLSKKGRRMPELLIKNLHPNLLQNMMFRRILPMQGSQTGVILRNLMTQSD